MARSCLRFKFEDLAASTELRRFLNCRTFSSCVLASLRRSATPNERRLRLPLWLKREEGFERLCSVPTTKQTSHFASAKSAKAGKLNEIRAEHCKVTDHFGLNLGMMTRMEARQLARAAHCDLQELAFLDRTSISRTKKRDGTGLTCNLYLQ